MNDLQKENLRKHFNRNIKEEIMIETMNMFDVLTYNFDSLTLDIKQAEIDIILDETYKLFEKKKWERFYKEAFDLYITNAVSDLMVEKKTVTKKTLLKKIFYFGYNYNKSYNLNKIEIILLKKAIQRRFFLIKESEKGKVISLSQYRNNRK